MQTETQPSTDSAPQLPVPAQTTPAQPASIQPGPVQSAPVQSATATQIPADSSAQLPFPSGTQLPTATSATGPPMQPVGAMQFANQGAVQMVPPKPTSAGQTGHLLLRPMPASSGQIIASPSNAWQNQLIAAARPPQSYAATQRLPPMNCPVPNVVAASMPWGVRPPMQQSLPASHVSTSRPQGQMMVPRPGTSVLHQTMQQAAMTPGQPVTNPAGGLAPISQAAQYHPGAAAGGAESRMPVPSHRLANQGTLRGHMPQISSQAYIQQASAQLQKYQPNPMYPFPANMQPSRPPPATTSFAQMRPSPQQAGPGQAGSIRMAAPSVQTRPPYASLPGRGQQLSSAPVNNTRVPLIQGRTMPTSGPVASIPHIKRAGAPKVEWLSPTMTQVPGIFTVNDRKVRAYPGEEESVPMYVLLRRWAQNDPNLYPPPPPSSATNGQPLQMWPRHDPEVAGPSPPKALPFDPLRTRFSPEELLKHHKHHWQRIRRHHISKRNSRLNQFRQHLAAIIPEPEAELSSPPSKPGNSSAAAATLQGESVDGDKGAGSMQEAAAGEELEPDRGELQAPAAQGHGATQEFVMLE